MNGARRLKAPAHVMSRKIGDEHVLLDVEKGVYFGLDAVGSRLWELIEAAPTVDEMVAAVVREYEVEEPDARRDVVRLMQELLDRGLVGDA